MADNKFKRKNILAITTAFVLILLIGYILVNKFFLDTKNTEMMNNGETNELAADEKKIANDAEEIKIINGDGKIKKVAGIEPEELRVVSLGKVTDVDEEGNFSTSIYDKTVTPVMAMLPDKEFGLMAMSEPGSEKIMLDAQTTAETLVFMSPYLITSEPELASEIMKVIKNNIDVEKFGKTIEKVLEKDVEPLDDQEYTMAFRKAVESVLSDLNPQ